MSSLAKKLDLFERSKILEIYFSRIEGFVPETIPLGEEDIYSADINEIKIYLMGQMTSDSILRSILNSTKQV